MRFLDARPRDFVAPSDEEPRTTWSIRPLSFFDTEAISRETGRAPVRELKLYYGLVPPEEPAPEGESQEEADARLLRRAEAFRAAYQALSEDDQDAVETAKSYLVRYNFSVCSRGVAAIDGEKLTTLQVAERLGMMVPRETARTIIAEVANAIGDLTRGEVKKKDSSGRRAG